MEKSTKKEIKIKFTFLSVFLFILFELQAQSSDFNHIDFQKADRIALSHKNEELSNLPLLSHKLTSELETDVEKFRAIYVWVATNIKVDYQMFIKNKRKRKKFKSDSIRLNEWNSSLSKEMFAKLLKKKRTVCTGYAYLIKELSSFANIDCEIVDGFGKINMDTKMEWDSPNHSWNAVLLNGKWYLCDATWASGDYNPNTDRFEYKLKKGYFLTDPRLFATNHYPLNQKWLLISKKKPSFQEFTDGPLVYSAAYEYSSLYISPKEMFNVVHKKEKVDFELKLPTSLTNSKRILLLISGRKRDDLKEPKSMIQKDGTITFEYYFPSSGYFDLHIMIEDTPIMTYAFHVKK